MRLWIFLFLLAPRCFASKCKTCRGQQCENNDKDLLESCTIFSSTVPFADLAHSDKKLLDYGCLELKYFKGSSNEIIEKCVMAENLDTVCAKIAEKLSYQICNVHQPIEDQHFLPSIKNPGYHTSNKNRLQTSRIEKSYDQESIENHDSDSSNFNPSPGSKIDIYTAKIIDSSESGPNEATIISWQITTDSKSSGDDESNDVTQGSLVPQEPLETTTKSSEISSEETTTSGSLDFNQTDSQVTQDSFVPQEPLETTSKSSETSSQETTTSGSLDFNETDSKVTQDSLVPQEPLETTTKSSEIFSEETTTSGLLDFNETDSKVTQDSLVPQEPLETTTKSSEISLEETTTTGLLDFNETDSEVTQDSLVPQEPLETTTKSSEISPEETTTSGSLDFNETDSKVTQDSLVPQEPLDFNQTDSKFEETSSISALNNNEFDDNIGKSTIGNQLQPGPSDSTKSVTYDIWGDSNSGLLTTQGSLLNSDWATEVSTIHDTETTIKVTTVYEENITSDNNLIVNETSPESNNETWLGDSPDAADVTTEDFKKANDITGSSTIDWSSENSSAVAINFDLPEEATPNPNTVISEAASTKFGVDFSDSLTTEFVTTIIIPKESTLVQETSSVNYINQNKETSANNVWQDSSTVGSFDDSTSLNSNIPSTESHALDVVSLANASNKEEAKNPDSTPPIINKSNQWQDSAATGGQGYALDDVGDVPLKNEERINPDSTSPINDESNLWQDSSTVAGATTRREWKDYFTTDSFDKKISHSEGSSLDDVKTTSNRKEANNPYSTPLIEESNDWKDLFDNSTQKSPNYSTSGIEGNSMDDSGVPLENTANEETIYPPSFNIPDIGGHSLNDSGNIPLETASNGEEANHPYPDWTTSVSFDVSVDDSSEIALDNTSNFNPNPGDSSLPIHWQDVSTASDANTSEDSIIISSFDDLLHTDISISTVSAPSGEESPGVNNFENIPLNDESYETDINSSTIIISTVVFEDLANDTSTVNYENLSSAASKIYLSSPFYFIAFVAFYIRK